MKARILLVWLAIAAVAALSAGATHWALCGRKPFAQGQLSDASFLTRALDLSPVQAQEIARQQAAVAAELADCCARHCAARAQLGPALAAGADGEARAKNLIAEMGRAYQQSEQATWTHIRQVRALLTPVQQARYDALINRCVCGPCNMSNASRSQL